MEEAILGTIQLIDYEAAAQYLSVAQRHYCFYRDFKKDKPPVIIGKICI